MSLGTGRAIAFGATAGALVVGAAWGASSYSSRGGSTPAVTASSPVRVTACTPGHAVTMDLAATNSGADIVSYSLTAYWFQASGAVFLTQPITTDPIQPGHTLTVHAGNPADTEDWQAGLTCHVKVTGSN